MQARLGPLKVTTMDPPQATVACSRCGALNGADFKQCVRCGKALDGAEPADRAARRVPVRRPAQRLHGATDGLLGRWDAVDLPATKLLVAINFAVFAIQLVMAFSKDPTWTALLTGGTDMAFLLKFGALPIGLLDDVGSLDRLMMRQEPWRVLSACYVHFGIIHVGMNMLGLINLARIAEPAIGSPRFLLLYVLTGIVGFAASIAWFFVSPSASLTGGASGAVFGVMGMVLGFLWRRRDERWKAWLGQAVVYSLGFTLLLPSINHAAHLGGLVSGTIIGALFAPGAPSTSRPWQRWAAYACVALSLASLVAVQVSPYVKALEHAAGP